MEFWFINFAGTLECLWKSKMTAIRRSILNLLVVFDVRKLLGSHILSEIDLLLAFLGQIAPEL